MTAIEPTAQFAARAGLNPGSKLHYARMNREMREVKPQDGWARFEPVPNSETGTFVISNPVYAYQRGERVLFFEMDWMIEKVTGHVSDRQTLHCRVTA